MKRLALVLLLLPLLAGADSIPQLTDEQIKLCEEEGGCYLMTRKALAAMVRGVEMQTMDQARKQCVMGGVGRDS